MEAFTGQVKVDEQELEKTAVNAKTKISRYKNKLEEMNSLIQETALYWEGEGGDHYRKIFLTQKKEVDQMLSEYKKYTRQLLEQSQKAKKARQEGQEKANQLNSLEMC